MKNKILFLKGLPASGKSTFARNLVKTEPNWVRVNKDDLRAMLHDSFWSKQNEKYIISVRDNLVRHALANNKNVVVDDTNFYKPHEYDLKLISDEFEVDFEVMEFDTSLEECIRRDEKRKPSVGKEVIINMWKKYLKPLPYEAPKGVDTLGYIFDIDGTLALNNGHRGFHDYDKVFDDTPNYPIIAMAHTLYDAGYKILIVSGRKDSCRKDTERWLKKYGVKYEELFMRKTGDNRNDAVVKKEIFENEIRQNYLPMGIYDDRPRVIRMWKELGLFVFDCGDGIEF